MLLKNSFKNIGKLTKRKVKKRKSIKIIKKNIFRVLKISGRNTKRKLIRKRL